MNEKDKIINKVHGAILKALNDRGIKYTEFKEDESIQATVNGKKVIIKVEVK
jgi:hypothetical protein